MRRFLKFIQSKIFITAILVLIQLIVLFYFLISLTNNFVWYYVIGLILSVITVLDISSEPMNPSFKLTWIIAAMLFPLCGVPLYLIFAKSKQVIPLSNEVRTMRLISFLLLSAPKLCHKPRDKVLIINPELPHLR